MEKPHNPNSPAVISAQPRLHQSAPEIQQYGTVTHLLPLELEEPVRLEMTERLGHGRRRQARQRGVERRHVGANRRGPGRVDSRAEAILDELEARFDARAGRRDPPQDLADRLDSLGVGLDRQLEPSAGPPGRSRAPRSPRRDPS